MLKSRQNRQYWILSQKCKFGVRYLQNARPDLNVDFSTSSSSGALLYILELERCV